MGERIRIADRVAQAMLDNDYGHTIMWGDGLLNDAVCGFIKGRLSRHPLDRMTAACNALERAPDLFEKRMIRGVDCSNHERVVRGFKLIGKPRAALTPTEGSGS